MVSGRSELISSKKSESWLNNKWKEPQGGKKFAKDEGQGEKIATTAQIGLTFEALKLRAKTGGEIFPCFFKKEGKLERSGSKRKGGEPNFPKTRKDAFGPGRAKV